MLAASRRYRSLKDLIQTQLSDLTSDDVPGIVVMLPHLKRLDVYTTLGTGADNSPEFLKSLTWVFAEKSGEGWVCTEIEERLRDQFIENMN